MRNLGSSPTVIDCIFTGNYADDRGGGMYNREGSPTVIGTTFLQNTAVAMGGGMFNLRASPTIRDCRFTENSANKGAGMRNYINSHPTVTDSIFDYNHAGEEGGGMDNRKNSNPVVTGCLFIGNTAVSGGGGMHNYVGNAVATGNPTIINSLFAGNSASSGGGMRNNDPNPTIINTTFAYNEGGAAINSRNGSAALLKNCIVWGHTEGFVSGKTASSTIVSFSNIQGGFPGIGNLDLDPLFVNSANDDYHLTPMSPVINAGTNDPPLPATDLDGEPRIMGGTVDMGAYELGICSAAEEIDNDGDGYTVCGGDCNDSDGSVYPSAVEVCGDGIDNNCNGAVDEGCGTANTAPVASFGASCTALSCNFTDTSTGSDGSIASWSWSFGDGNTASNQDPSHTFATAGTYNVTLTVTDNAGATSGPASQSVTVSEPAGDLAVTSISPSTMQMPTTFLATITGTGFAAGAQVSFSNGDGPTPKVTNVIVVSSTIIEATIKIKTGGPPRSRMWDLTVTAGGSSVTLQDALTVLP